MKVYITKYALTAGIEELEIPDDEKDAFSEEGYLSFITREPWRQHFYSKKEWHLTKTKAIISAEEMRNAKIASIDKQRKRIAALTFE